MLKERLSFPAHTRRGMPPCSKACTQSSKAWWLSRGVTHWEVGLRGIVSALVTRRTFWFSDKRGLFSVKRSLASVLCAESTLRRDRSRESRAVVRASPARAVPVERARLHRTRSLQYRTLY